MRPRIAVLGYEPLGQLFRQVLLGRDLPYEVQFVQALFEEALPAARELERSGRADAFVAGAVNYPLLRDRLRLPVVPLTITGYDLLRAIARAADHGHRILVMSYRERRLPAEDLRAVFRVQVDEEVFTSWEEADGIVRRRRDAGWTVLVGPSVACELAGQHGLHGVLAYGPDTLLRALQQAYEMATARLAEAQRTEELRTILQFAPTGIIAADGNGRITVFNPALERLTGIAAGEAVGRPADEVVPALELGRVLESGAPSLAAVAQLGPLEVVTNRVPVTVQGRPAGVVATVWDARSVEESEVAVRRVRHGRGLVARFTFAHVVGESPALRQAVAAARRFARAEQPILIYGETGTGKELFAQSIHNASRRAGRPFVAINCAAVPESLLESELFGFEEGAFTGARRGGKPGLMELAHTGTLFLDEVAELSPPLQTKLLRALQEREIMRVGGDRLIPVDVRVVAATSRDLDAEVAAGRFREDLYYRLNVLELRLPPLRERREDVPLLVRHFLAGRPQALVEAAVAGIAAHLGDYPWPGNVRELENLLSRFIALADTEEGKTPPAALMAELARQLQSRARTRRVRSAREDEVRRIAEAMAAEGGNRAAAARRLGISRSTLWRKLRELNGPGV
ncbi:sigma 54-interacting transcriptional regulator [Caldinitratiruptor microaerophilus]|uniref:sigma 54-interacting transcriptional regulator n=1 Tax=Caldinitratiruptor microaerophilus TaxID=671077 RepID=UPI00222EB08C|nr:sigma 54-interacting transcriptional regulator [Caldinitratiruptor microaerophilus]